MSMIEQAKQVFPYVVEMRRSFHRWPEPSMQEFKTTEKIAEELDKIGIPYRRLNPTGIIGEITGGHPGKTVALRADIDALSITEKSDVEFISENVGYMHACGHDTHPAMLLGAAKILKEGRGGLNGTVRLVFQPGEESGEGAKAVVAQGGIDGVDAMFGIHIFSLGPVGCVAASSGTIFPAVGSFRIIVRGKTCHGGTPELGIDATLAASAIVLNLQSIVSREMSPLMPMVVSVGSLHSGSRYNIISGEAVMEGTVRIFDEKQHEAVPGIMERIIKRTAEAYRCEAELEYEFGSHALITDAAVTEQVRKSALKILPDPELLVSMPSAMGGEDFSEYAARIPSSYVGLGAGGSYPQHSERYLIDESAFLYGTALYVQFVMDYLNG